MEGKKLKGNLLDRVIPLVILVALALLILNNVMLYGRGTKVAEAKALMEEELRPAGVELIKITSEGCSSCFDIDKAIDELNAQNVNITREETLSRNSQQGKELISKYHIEKLPTILVRGELGKSERLTQYFEEKGDIREGMFIYTSLLPPYVDVASNQVKGLVQIKHVVDSSCEDCVDLTPLSSALEEQGVFVQDKQLIEYDSLEGQELISRFGIKEIPAIIISGEINYYPDVKEALVQSGAVQKGGFYAVHSTLPPYRDLAKNRVVGLVDVVYLTISSCPSCYDVSINRNILLRFGLALNKENTHGISSPEGKQFVQKYNIKKVPIIILSPDSEYYPSLVQAWKSVGTVESDGWFVMRNPEMIGTYWDLEHNKAVEADN